MHDYFKTEKLRYQGQKEIDFLSVKIMHVIF